MKPARSKHVSWMIIVVLGALIVTAAFTFYKGRSGERDVSQSQLLEWMEQESNLCILDVRTAGEYASGHIPGVINISHEEVSAHLDELTAHKGKNIVVYCQRGGRARMAQDTLVKA